MSTASTELRNPVTSIRDALGLLGPMRATLDPKGVEIVDLAMRNAERLTRPLNDILDIEKIEAGRMNFDMQRHDLRGLMKDAVEMHRAHAHARVVRNAIGAPDKPLVVSADADRLQQVISSLLSNAITCSPEHGLVTITAERHGADVRIGMTDGPGARRAGAVQGAGVQQVRAGRRQRQPGKGRHGTWAVDRQGDCYFDLPLSGDNRSGQ